MSEEGEVMATKRLERLARAIDALSGRDLVEFADMLIPDHFQDSGVRRYGIERRVLNWSKKIINEHGDGE